MKDNKVDYMNNKIDITFLERCVLALEKALELFNSSEEENILSDLYRSASIKEFEIILEQAGKLVKKCLKPYFHSSQEVDKLYFKDVFRYAAKYGIITLEECERWLQYRDNRNSTAHNYGIGFAEETLLLLPQFIEDSRALIKAIERENNDSD